MTSTSSEVAGSPDSAMLAALVRLRDALRRNTLPFDLPDVERSRVARAELVEQLEDYLLPRMTRLDAPLLAVVGGSTGAGKSTLVNSLVGTRVTVPGVLRPTTRSSVLVHHPDDREWFGLGHVLPGLERTDKPSSDPEVLQLVETTAMPPGLALLDAPDVDSVEERNRRLAAQLLAAADLWLFVTTAARYADQVPWDHLRQAVEREVSVAVVLDRTAPDAIEEVSSHLARMLTARGLSDTPLFLVEEAVTGGDGLLPVRSVQQVRDWLGELAQDADAREVVVRRTLDGALRSASHRAHLLADAAGEQAGVRGQLVREVEQAYADSAAAADRAVADGALLRGEVLARWQEFVGSGELLQGLESKVSWLRDRIGKAVRGHPQQAGRVLVAVGSGLETLVLEAAEVAAVGAAAAWDSGPAGRVLLTGGSRELARASRGLRSEAARSLHEWQEQVLDTIRREGAEKRTSARFLAYGVNGLGVALMVLTLAAREESGTGPAGDPVARRLLDAVFGEAVVRRMVDDAVADLTARVHRLLLAEGRRFRTRLETVQVTADGAEQIRAAARALDDERFAQKTVERRTDGDRPGGRERVEDLL